MTAVDVEIWACPTPGCGNYYGASSAGDLAGAPIQPRVEAVLKAPLGMRSRCPMCTQRGMAVDRVLVRATLHVPEAAIVDA